jgi:hypothetical protein
MDLNVTALCLFTSEVIKDMRDRGVDDGHIFHIGRYTIYTEKNYVLSNKKLSSALGCQKSFMSRNMTLSC